MHSDVHREPEAAEAARAANRTPFVTASALIKPRRVAHSVAGRSGADGAARAGVLDARAHMTPLRRPASAFGQP